MKGNLERIPDPEPEGPRPWEADGAKGGGGEGLFWRKDRALARLSIGGDWELIFVFAVVVYSPKIDT